LRSKATASGSSCWNADRSAPALSRAVVRAGIGRENRRDRNASRVGDISMSALYIRCRSMFCRRMSTMKAMRGFRAAI
jgi:hypothetical protein